MCGILTGVLPCPNQKPYRLIRFFDWVTDELIPQIMDGVLGGADVSLRVHERQSIVGEGRGLRAH